MISEDPTFTGFHWLTGCQRDPQDRGVTGIGLVLLPLLRMPSVLANAPLSKKNKGEISALVFK